jgi:NADH-quinone oxidoreductase subunit D
MSKVTPLTANQGLSEQGNTVAWSLGPYHPSLCGPMQLKLQLCADRIASCRVESGYLRKNVESVLQRKSWASILPCLDHIDPENALAYELVFCLALEEILELSVPLRGQDIRIILCELSRMVAHLRFLAEFASALNAQTMVHYLLRDRERLLDLFELLTGVRFSYNFLQIGGVKSNLSDGFLERILEACDLIGFRIREYNNLFIYNIVVTQRCVGLGVLSFDQACDLGMTGPNALASGVACDQRQLLGYSGYKRVEFVSVPKRFQQGDVHSRCLLRLHQIEESMSIIKQVVARIPAGDFSLELESGASLGLVSMGEAFTKVESSRGQLACHVVSSGAGVPTRISFRPPSSFHLQALENVLLGQGLDDVAVLLKSFDICLSEADR